MAAAAYLCIAPLAVDDTIVRAQAKEYQRTPNAFFPLIL